LIGHLGRYEIIEQLGRGAMGIVYKAYDPLIERFVAIKTIRLQALSETERTEYEARFYQEAKAAGHLNHTNIVTIHDLGESGDVAYIAMELMEGRELQEMIDGKRRLLVTDALSIAIQVATGLSYAHQRGIVHGDIKPSNIMVLGDNHVKIADFGIAKMASSVERTQNDVIYGTPSFMSPEQIQGKSIDARSDIFSLGVVLYYMLTDRLPFFEDNINLLVNQIVGIVPEKPSSLNPGISAALDTVIYKCLAKNPDERYANAKELADDLRSCREALLHVSAGHYHPFMTSLKFKHLKQVAIPGGISQNSATIGSYFAIAAIFIFDNVTPSTIQMHLLYIFPLIVISFHRENMRLVNGAVILALLLQGLHLVTDATLPMSSKIFLAIMVFLSNIMIVYVSRIARTNFFEVEQLSSFDGLTGLRNRLSFEAIIDIEIERQKRHGGVFSFAYVDLNNFREFNESRGYAAGDGALKLVAQVIRGNIRQSDTPARIGGDEFAILMPNTNATDCESLCQLL
jgi:serine/threonine protein kinase